MSRRTETLLRCIRLSVFQYILKAEMQYTVYEITALNNQGKHGQNYSEASLTISSEIRPTTLTLCLYFACYTLCVVLMLCIQDKLLG